MNDALLSGSAHFISAGPPAFLHLVGPHPQQCGREVHRRHQLDPDAPERARRPVEVAGRNYRRYRRSRSPLSRCRSLPSSCRCMRRRNRPGSVFRFDPSTVTMAHPDALIAVTSGNAEIVGHWASAPFDQRELKDPAIHTIMNSDDVMGGSTTFTMMSTTTRFQAENPKVTAAVLKALKAAQKMIAEDKRNAAAVLLESMGGKGWSVDDLVAILDDPGTKYTTKPENVLKYGAFMNEIGCSRTSRRRSRSVLRHAGNRRRQFRAPTSRASFSGRRAASTRWISRSRMAGLPPRRGGGRRGRSANRAASPPSAPRGTCRPAAHTRTARPH